MHVLDRANLSSHTRSMVTEPNEPSEQPVFIQLMPVPIPPHLPPHLAREVEFQARLTAERERRWRRRRLTFAVLTPVMGTLLPVLGLLLAGSIANGSWWAWISNGGWLPLMLTVVGSITAAIIAFLNGWDIIRGMMLYGGVFIAVVAITRTSIGSLLPAMPGLVSVFVMSGAIVGYLISLEDEHG